MPDLSPRGMISGAAYAAGKRAKAQCPVCADAVPYRSLRKRWDGQYVCRGCLDPKHPAELRRTFKDAIALHHPRRDNSRHDVSVGFGLFASTTDWAGNFTVVVS